MNVSDDIAAESRSTQSPTQRFELRTVLSNMLFGTRFVPIWLAMAVLLVICKIVAPSTLSSASWSSVLPLGSVVAIVALGQMLVIMMGGIDLSMGATISICANVLVGVSKGTESGFTNAIIWVFVVAIVIGFINGFLIAMFELNPLIVTLATSLIILGINTEYRKGTAQSTTVPDSLADFVFDKTFGISKLFWFGVILTLVLGGIIRSTTVGRRFQAVGANRRAAWMAGIRVRVYVIGAYVCASIAGGLAAIFAAGIVVSPGVDPGAKYLLGPVAAVVLGGAALSGGLASPASTWVAAFFVTILNQMLRVFGLSNAWQNVVFGVAIVLGMLFSGDRIADLIGRLLVRPSLQKFMGGEGEPPATPAAQLETVPS